MKELIKDVPDYEGIYQISEDGTLFSVERRVTRNNGVVITRKRRARKYHVDHNGYAVYHTVKEHKHHTLRRARIMWQTFVGEITEGFDIDHIDRNKLNDSLANLRLATKAQNGYNKRSFGPTSRYKGVHQHQKGFVAQISIGGVSKYLGYFQKEEDAARAYDEVARELHGEFFVPNL
jgi:hypothetical protein